MVTFSWDSVLGKGRQDISKTNSLSKCSHTIIQYVKARKQISTIKLHPSATPHQRVNFHRINPLEEGVAPAIQVHRPCSHKKSGSSKKAIQASWLFRRICRSHPFFPVVQMIGLQYSVLGQSRYPGLPGGYHHCCC